MSEIAFSDREKMVALLADQAVNSGRDSGVFYRNLILQLNLPKQVQNNRVGAAQGDPEAVARDLVKWAADFGTNPNTKIPALGSIAQSMLPFAGVENATMLAAVIVYNRLLPQDQLNALRIQFQIPKSLAETERAAALGPTGPAFDWKGPTDVQLQGWFYPAVPEFLEVSMLQKALDRARSVCRVEIPSIAEAGTGVLIRDDLVLTNYHVLTKNPNDLTTNAKNTTLRFGAFATQAPGAPPAGEEVKLDAANPVVAFSPVAEYDFVLLRTAGKATNAAATPYASPVPAADTAMNILQHPQAGPMMLALSANGVTSADPVSGKIQYITRSAGGSSGSPCFDKDWNLVAIHHAEVPKPLGSVREGILMKSILSLIEPCLK